MNEKRRLVERITDPDYVESLEEQSMAKLREMRSESSEGENELSFERRLCQARLDILKAELRRRETGEEQDLLARLPEILSSALGGGSETPIPQRAPDFSIPRSADVPRRRVEEIVGEQTLARLHEVDEAELNEIIESLNQHEQKISARRKRVHEVIDRIQAEIVRRYSSGEADPSEALA